MVMVKVMAMAMVIVMVIMAMVMVTVMIMDIVVSSISWGRELRRSPWRALRHGLRQLWAVVVPIQLDSRLASRYQLEQDAAYYCPCSRIKNTVEELRRAWTEYYAYGPDEHEALFEANSKLRGLKQVWKPPLNPNSSASSYF